METLEIDSTSTDSARISDIIIRETSTTRLIFRGTLVNNIHNKLAPLKGDFIFQRKGTLQNWEDIESQSFSTLKKEDAYKLSLKSGELKVFLIKLQVSMIFTVVMAFHLASIIILRKEIVSSLKVE